MNRLLVFVLLAGVTALGTQISSLSAPPNPASAASAASAATFNKDVLPILQNNCQVCHRPGGIGPMSFMTYESTRPWAKSIRTAVLSRQMPPWLADAHVGEFRNAPKLTTADIQTLTAWVDSGALEGNAADKPAPIQWTDGWRTQPDVIVSMPEPYRIAAKGEGEVKEFFVENPFKEDTWVSSIEVRPGNPSVVHHVIVQVRDQNQQTLVFKRASCADCGQVVVRENIVQIKTLSNVLQAGQAAPQPVAQTTAPLTGDDVVVMLKTQINGLGGGPSSYNDQLVRLQEQRTGRGHFTTMEAVYAPGSPPQDFRYNDAAKLIPAGKPIRIEVHYTPNGKEATDQTMVGFTLAKGPTQRRFVIMAPEHLIDDRKPIPAGENNWESKGELTFNQDAELVWFMPHMHLRGKDMTFRLIHPDGREETVLSARFNFNWQLGYEVEKPIKVSRGARMVVTSHHDNSANNPYNPTPDQPAVWGEMTTQEMMLPWFGVVVDGNSTPDMIASYRPGFLD